MALPPHRGAAFWGFMVLAAAIALLGLAMAAGGLWLVILGGSWYYLIAGLALTVAGVLMIRRRSSGVWLYLGVFAATVIWALWEVGLDMWALLPRLLALAVLGVVALCFVPWLRRHGRGDPRDNRTAAT